MADLWRIAVQAAGHFEEAAQTCVASEPPVWGWGKGLHLGQTGELSAPRVRLLPSTGCDPFCGSPQIAPRHPQLGIGSRRGTSARKGERRTSFVCARPLDGRDKAHLVLCLIWFARMASAFAISRNNLVYQSITK